MVRACQVTAMRRNARARVGLLPSGSALRIPGHGDVAVPEAERERVVRVLGRFAGQELPWPPDREKKFWSRLLYLGLLEPAGERSTSSGGDEL